MVSYRFPSTPFRRPLLAALALALSAGLAPPAAAAPDEASGLEPRVAELVADLAPLGTGGGSEPRGFYRLGERSVFFAFQPGSGYEPWSTDGTLGGTELLADTCPGPCPSGRTDLSSLTVAGEQIFWAEIEEEGSFSYLTRLWRSDGTAAGTYPLTDTDSLLPTAGNIGPYVVPLDAPAGESRLLFLAFALEEGAPPGMPGTLQLWRTDGSRAGTRRVADLGPRFQNTVLVASEGRAHVLIETGTPDLQSVQVWVSDGTPDGTRPLTEVEGRGLTDTVSAGGRAFFNLRTDDQPGWEIWSAGDTPESVGSLGRHFVGTDWRGIFPWLAAVGDQAVFALAEVRSDTGELVDTYQLWASDGTPAGTRALTAFRSVDSLPDDLAPENLAVLGDRLLFPAFEVDGPPPPYFDLELWSAPLHGEAGAAVRVKDLCPDCHGLGPPGLEGDIPELIELGGRVYFAATDNEAETGIWWTDGATLTRACPAGVPACSNVVRVLPLPDREHAEDILFVARAEDGDDLWQLDPSGGTPRCLTRFTAARPFPERYVSLPWTGQSPAGDDAFLFAAGEASTGEEPWLARGAGTHLLKDIHQTAASSQPRDLTALGDRLLFLASAEGSMPGDLWAAAAPAPGAPGASPVRIFEIPNPSLCALTGIRGLVAAETLAYFFCGREQLSLEIWRTDGTAAGTVLLARPAGVSSLEDRLAGDAILTDPAVWGDRAYFAVNTHVGIEVWESDGTAAGTGPVASIQGDDPAHPAIAAEVIATGGQVFLHGRDVLDGPGAVWSSDGTQAGTTRRLSVPFGYTLALDAWRVSGDAVFLPFDALGDDTLQVWRTDGTDAGTGLVVEIPVGFWLDGAEVYPAPPALQDPPREPDFFFLVGDTPLDALTLWTVPASGDVAVEVGPAGRTATVPFFRTAELTAAHGRAFFVAADPEHGTELWVTDGTAAGTGMVVDGNPGPGSSDPRDLTFLDGLLYFSANDGRHGLEVWTSDGTAAGTGMVHDLAPGPASAGNRPTDPSEVPPIVHTPGGYARVGDRVYFRADDGLYGEELWSLPPEGGPCEPSPRHLCLAGGRFRVEVTALVDRTGGERLPEVVRGTARPLSADTGAFWLFREQNLETAVKVIDGRPVNEHFWVFRTALSNLPLSLTVTDHATGLTRRYQQTGGRSVSDGDTTAFGPRGVPLERRHAAAVPSAAAGTAPAAASGAEEAAPHAHRLLPVSGRGTCAPGPERLCLLGGRYAVEVAWTRPNGAAGTGRAVPLTSDPAGGAAGSETGAFWFFREANLELFVKMVDGAEVNGHVWFFSGALSNVGYTVTVTETATGRTRTYESPQGSFTSVADGNAFDVRPGAGN